MPQSGEAEERVLCSVRCLAERERLLSLWRASVGEQQRDVHCVRPTSIASNRERAASSDRDSANATASVTQLSIDIDGDTGAFEDDVEPETDAGVDVDSDSCVFAAGTPAARERDEPEASRATVRHLSLDSLQQAGLCGVPMAPVGEDGSDEYDEAAESCSGDELSVVSLPTPPDGGWGWIVVLAAFAVNMIVDGISCSYGVFFMILEEEFGASKSQTALVGSLFWGVPLLAAPLSAPLINKFGCRAVCMAGALVAFVGVFAAQFSTSLELLCVSYGLVAGLGLSMVALPSTVVVSYYFEARRAFATGLSVAGSGVGTFVLAPLTEYLVLHYDWRSYMLLLSGIVLNLAVCGALLRPIETKREKRQRRLLSALERFSKQCSKDASLQSSLQSIAYQHSDVPTRLLFIRQALSDPKVKTSSVVAAAAAAATAASTAALAFRQVTDSDFTPEHDCDFRVALLSEPPPPTAAVTPLQAIPEHEVIELFTDTVPLPHPHPPSLSLSNQPDTAASTSTGIAATSSNAALATTITSVTVTVAMETDRTTDEEYQRCPSTTHASLEAHCAAVPKCGRWLESTECTCTPGDERERMRDEPERQYEHERRRALSRSSEALCRHAEPTPDREGYAKRRARNNKSPRKATQTSSRANEEDDAATTAVSVAIAPQPRYRAQPRVAPQNSPVAAPPPLAARTRGPRSKVFGQHLAHGAAATAAHRLRRGRAGAAPGPECGDDAAYASIYGAAPPSPSVWIRTGAQSGTGAVLLPAALYPRAQFAPLNRRDIFYRGTLEHVPLYCSYKTASCPELYRPASVSSDSHSSSSRDDALDRLVDILRLKSAKQVMKVMLDVKLFGNLAYLLLFLSNLLFFVGYNVAYFFLTDYAVSRRVSLERAPLLVSFIGILNTAGQITIGYVGDRPEVNTVLVYAVCIGVTGVGTLFVPSIAVSGSTFVGLSTYAGLFGFFSAANVSLGTIIMVEAIGLERLTNGFSLMMCGQGVANIIGPPLLGWIIAQSGDFPAAFYAGGVLLLASAALIVFVPLLHRQPRESDSEPPVDADSQGDSHKDRERSRTQSGSLSRTASGKDRHRAAEASDRAADTPDDSRPDCFHTQPMRLVARPVAHAATADDSLAQSTV